MTVSLVLVSHLAELADGARRLAAQMAPEVRVLAAGGTDDGGIGTSLDKVLAALGEAGGADGTVVLFDLGSAQLIAETAVEMLGDAQTRIVDAPLVEGAVAAATVAQQGAALDDVVEAARGQLTRVGEEQAPVRPGPGALTVEVTLANPLGLHARPAARLAGTLTGRDAVVLLSGTDGDWVDARSVVAVIGLGLRGGDGVRVAAEGAAADEALRLVVELVEAGFGELEEHATGARQVMSGVAASPGQAEGDALLVVVPTLTVEAEQTSADEEQRLTAALERAGAGLEDTDEAFQTIARAHRTLLGDPMLRGRAMTLVGAGSAAGIAWAAAVREAHAMLSRLADAAMADRAGDVLDVGARVSAALAGREYHAGLPGEDLAGRVLVGEQILPSQVVRAHRLGAVGLVASGGGATAHAAQLARVLGVPAVFGLGGGVLGIRDGQRLRVDGSDGSVQVLSSPPE